MANKRKIRIAITLGDPSGIGPEIVKKAMQKLTGFAEFIVIGDRGAYDLHSSFGKKLKFKFIDLDNVKKKDFSFGCVHAEYAKASIEYLDKAVELFREDMFDALVTAPISKESIQLAGFSYNGHTEYFSIKTDALDTVMMLLNDKLKFSLLTRHIPIKDVSGALSQSIIEKNVMTTKSALKKYFNLKSPRIAVCALNPHASDNGLIGQEEVKIIKPAVKAICNGKARDFSLSGPIPADTAVILAMRKKFDCLIALYHDQALIPLKITGADSGVNFTLGLPFIRTSPLHGVAFDIAGKNKANPLSMIAAIKIAKQCVLNQRKNSARISS